jgi:hypothetical protein
VASTRQVQQPSSAPLVAAGAVALAGALAWKGWPFAVPLWLGLAVWGWTEPPVVLTGRKDASGMATPAGPTEQKALRRWAAAGQLKWRPLTPNADWLPGWPVLASWLAALTAAAVAWSAPVAVEKLRWVNAAAAYLAWVSFAGVRRRTMVDDDTCPGARIDTLPELIRESPRIAAGAVAAAIAAFWAATSLLPRFDPWAVGPGGSDTVAYRTPDAVSGLASYGFRHVTAAALALAVAAALGVLAVPWMNAALAHWRIVVAGRTEWNPRWQSLKFDPAPFLVDRQQVGSATVDTFFAPSSQGSAAFYQLRSKIEPTVGAGTKVAILETPNETAEGPVPGTLHPLRFEVVSWPTEQLPDCGDPSTPPAVAALWARCAFVWAHDAIGYGRPVLLGVEPLHTPDSPTAAWTSSWAWPGGPGLGIVRDQTLGDVGGQLACDALIDHRSDELFFGVLDPDADTDFAAQSNPPYPVRFERLALEDTWSFRWGEALKQATHAPTVEHSTTAEAELADGTVIYRQVFLTRLGIDPREFATAGQERKIATALQAAPFVTVRGYPLAGRRRGERHPQAVAVYWSKAPIPNSPQLLGPVPRSGANNAAEWVLGGLINDAFDHGRLSRPEITDAVCLTEPDARAHLWRITVRLHDGITLGDVRGAAQRIRQSLGVEWLRVTPVPDGAMLFCGVRPEVAKLASERRDRQVLISLDWEQAFLDAGVTGQAAQLPQLVASSTLPANQQVQVLDFQLPPGLSTQQVSAALSKLSAATNHTFVELRPGPNAQTVRLLASVDNPLPERVAFDFDAVDASPFIPFATGVEGEPVVFDHTESPHILLAGVTGAGKSQPLDSRVPVPVSDRFPDGWATIGELEIGDPVFAADGTPTPILGFSDIVEQPVHTLHFDTGESVDCGPEHLWKVSTAASRRVRTPNVNRARDERFQTLMARSARLRELAERAQAGLLASRPDLAALSGLSLTTVHRLLPETLAVKVDVPHGRKVDQVSIDDLVPRLEEIIDARGSVKIVESTIGRPQLAVLPAGGWLTIREITEVLLGRSSSRNERDRVKDLVRRSGAARRPGGQATETLTGFPVDEALTLFAEHFEHMAVRSDSGRQVRPLEEIVTAAEIAAAVTEASGRRNFAVRLPAAIGGPEADLPVDPYVLGAWLGDGNKRNGEITQSVDETCVDETARESDNAWLLAEIVRLGYDAHRKRSDDQVISVLNLRVPLREIGVLCNKHIPATYLRASAAQRLALLQGLMDTDGTIDARGSCELSLCDGRLAADALELVRSLGIKASITDAPASITEDDPERPGERRRRVTGTRWRIHFTTTTEVFRLPRKAARVPDGTRSTQGWRYVTGVTVGDPVPMRCISVDHPEHLYLTEGFVPTHNSVLAQAFVYGALVQGFEVNIVDPVKGGADFVFAKDRCRAFAQTPFEAAGVMRSVYAEVIRRKTINSEYGVGSIDELPEDIRPARVLTFIDEFTSLMGQALVPKSDDPEMQDEIEAIEAENRARAEIGMFVGKIAREARSAGVHLALGTQKLTAKMLDQIPGGAGNDLKTNLARTLLGKAPYGDRASALRAPDDAPKLEGDIPKGRGLWEPLSSAAMVVQCWFAPQSELREALVERVPALDPSLVLDLSQFAPATREETTGPPPRRQAPSRPAEVHVPDVVDVDEIELSLDDLELDVDGVEDPGSLDTLDGIEITWGAPDDAGGAPADDGDAAADDDGLVWDLPTLDDLEAETMSDDLGPDLPAPGGADVDQGLEWPGDGPGEEDPFAPLPRLQPALDGGDDEFAFPPPLKPADTGDDF